MSTPRPLLSTSLVLLTAVFALTSCQTPAGPTSRAANEFFVFYGVSDQGAGVGISLGRFNSTTGRLTTPALATEAAGPSFFTLSADGRFLYACHEPAGEVAAYTLDRATGALRLLNKLPSGGADPCHISLDRTGRFALVANYTGGSVAVFSIRPDGSLGERTAFDQHHGSGPHPNQQSAHSHAMLTDPTNRFALCADLGTDKIYIYRFDEKTGALTPNDPAFGVLAPGSGPRHLVFSQDGKIVYVTNELNATVTALRWDGARGALTEFQTIGNLPAGLSAAGTSNAEIALHPNGKFLYTSNRGQDRITVFAIDPASARLASVQDVSTRGQKPRFFGFDPTGQWLLANNQTSGTVALFKVDATNGQLTPTGDLLAAPHPDCMVFLPLPPAR